MNLDKLIQGVSRIVFDHRKAWLVVFAILTALFVASASRLVVDAGFSKMVPLRHEYMKVYREYEKVFGGANRVALALVQKDGDIYNKEFMDKLKGLTNDVFLLNGVDKPQVKSLFTPNTILVLGEGGVRTLNIPSGPKR